MNPLGINFSCPILKNMFHDKYKVESPPELNGMTQVTTMSSLYSLMMCCFTAVAFCLVMQPFSIIHSGELE